MHNTGNPLGSKDILDLYDNSETIDNFVNSQQDETPDRFGTKRLTLAGLIKRSMALRNEINDFSGALTFRPEWSDVPMNVSEGVGGEGGALNLQAEALGNRSEINKVTSREALRRSYAEVGYNLVDGSFEAGGTLVNANDVLLQERTGKAFSGSAGPVSAGTNPAIGGFTDRSDYFVGQALYSQIRNYVGTESHISCKGRTSTRDGGEGEFYLDVTDITTPDDDGTVLVTTTGARFKRAYTGDKQASWFGVNTTIADASVPMQSAVNKGGNIIIGDGQHTFLGTVTTDLTGAVYPLVGRDSTRYNIRGTSMHDTTINTTTSTAFSHTGNTYTVEADRGHGIYSNMNFSDFNIYGKNKQAVGIELLGLIRHKSENIRFKNLSIGMRMRGILVSDFENLDFEFCTNGLVLGSGSNSNINSVTLRDLKFGSCDRRAISGTVGTRVSFIGGDIEYSGLGDTTVPAGDDTGGMFLNVVEPMGVINISDYYFEGNEGLADIVINNATVSPIVVNISNTVFIRGNRYGRGCKFNIYTTSTGGGMIMLNLKSCYFFTQPSFGYVPKNSEPIILERDFLHVSGLDTCVSSERINVSRELVGRNSVIPVNVSGAGNKVTGPSWVSVERMATGTYRIFSTKYTFGKDLDGYTTLVTPSVSGFTGICTRVSEISMNVFIRDSTGALTNGAFSVGIIMAYGEGR